MAAENPVLQITQNEAGLALSWSDMWDGLGPDVRGFCAARQWAPIAASPVLNNGQFTVQVPAGSGAYSDSSSDEYGHD